MMEDPKHTLDSGENTQEERNAQYNKDQLAMETRNQETELLIKQMDNIETI